MRDRTNLLDYLKIEIIIEIVITRPLVRRIFTIYFTLHKRNKNKKVRKYWRRTSYAIISCETRVSFIRRSTTLEVRHFSRDILSVPNLMSISSSSYTRRHV